jgi:hypothetical protein
LRYELRDAREPPIWVGLENGLWWGMMVRI